MWGPGAHDASTRTQRGELRPVPAAWLLHRRELAEHGTEMRAARLPRHWPWPLPAAMPCIPPYRGTVRAGGTARRGGGAGRGGASREFTGLLSPPRRRAPSTQQAQHVALRERADWGPCARNKAGDRSPRPRTVHVRSPRYLRCPPPCLMQ